jgi:hypothetical protein
MVFEVFEVNTVTNCRIDQLETHTDQFERIAACYQGSRSRSRVQRSAELSVLMIVDAGSEINLQESLEKIGPAIYLFHLYSRRTINIRTRSRREGSSQISN